MIPSMLSPSQPQVKAITILTAEKELGPQYLQLHPRPRLRPRPVQTIGIQAGHRQDREEIVEEEAADGEEEEMVEEEAATGEEEEMMEEMMEEEEGDGF